jgi:hypothetical protein
LKKNGNDHQGCRLLPRARQRDVKKVDRGLNIVGVGGKAHVWHDDARRKTGILKRPSP